MWNVNKTGCNTISESNVNVSLIMQIENTLVFIVMLHNANSRLKDAYIFVIILAGIFFITTIVIIYLTKPSWVHCDEELTQKNMLILKEQIANTSTLDIQGLQIVRITKQISGGGIGYLYWDSAKNKCICTSNSTPYASWIIDGTAIVPSEGVQFTLRPTSMPNKALRYSENADLTLADYNLGDPNQQMSWTNFNGGWQINCGSPGQNWRISLYNDKLESTVGCLINAYNFPGSVNWGTSAMPNYCLQTASLGVIGCQSSGNCGEPLNSVISPLAMCQQCVNNSSWDVASLTCKCNSGYTASPSGCVQTVTPEPAQTPQPSTSPEATPQASLQPLNVSTQCPPCSSGTWPNCNCTSGQYDYRSNVCRCMDGIPLNATCQCNTQVSNLPYCPPCSSGIWPNCTCAAGQYDKSTNMCKCGDSSAMNLDTCSCTSSTQSQTVRYILYGGVGIGILLLLYIAMRH